MIRRYGPSRPFRNEILPLMIAAFLPVAVVALFPVAALRSLPTPVSERAALCSIVALSAEREREAIASARAAWQLDRLAVRRRRTDLFVDSLPAIPPRAVGAFGSRHRTDRRGVEPYEPDLLPFTRAAKPPMGIAPDDDADVSTRAFSREDLLKLN